MSDYRETKKVVVDAGHGGVDPGASGNGVIEKEYNLRIAKIKEKKHGKYVTFCAWIRTQRV